MPPQLWLPLLIILFFVGAFTKNPWLVVFSVALAAFIGLAQLWRKESLKKVFYRRRWHYHRGFPGEETSVRIEVENRKLLPVSWLRISDLWPKAAGPSDEEVLRSSHLTGYGRLTNLFSLRWFEKITREYKLKFKERGVYPVGPVDITSGDLFGLYESMRQETSRDTLTVFPELLPIHALDIRTENPMGLQRSRRHIYEDPNLPMGVRSYHPEDEFRRIHWPATARTGDLQVKVYQPVNSKMMVICLNIATSEQPWLGLNQPLSEHLIRVAATLAYQNIQEGYAVGLISNSCLAHSDQPFIIQPSNSPAQLAHLLESLANITLYVTGPFENFLARSLPQLPFGASLVIVAGIVTQGLCETLVRIKRYRTNTTLVSLASTPTPSIPGIHMIHMPFDFDRSGETA